MKRFLLFLNLLFLLASCATPTQQWLNDQRSYVEFKDETVVVQLANINKSDTVDLEYRVRVFPLEKELNRFNKSRDLDMNDSCFVLMAGNHEYLPQVVEPVVNGIKDCKEYLLVYKIQPEMINKSLAFIYNDKIPNFNRRILILNEKQ